MKWEYAVSQIDTNYPEQVEAFLDKLGAEQWEVFNVMGDGMFATVYAKRPIPEGE